MISSPVPTVPRYCSYCSVEITGLNVWRWPLRTPLGPNAWGDLFTCELAACRNWVQSYTKTQEGLSVYSIASGYGLKRGYSETLEEFVKRIAYVSLLPNRTS